jgi:enterochelin esterase-like enzyme
MSAFGCWQQVALPLILFAKGKKCFATLTNMEVSTFGTQIIEWQVGQRRMSHRIARINVRADQERHWGRSLLCKQLRRSKFASGLPGEQRNYYVYTPPGYDSKGTRAYPVLYLLHGYAQTAADWTVPGGANFILDNLIAQNKARPMIVVMPLGYGSIDVSPKRS